MTARPVAKEPRPYLFPGVQRDALPNGMRLLVVPMPRLPLVSVLAVIDAGAAVDPAGAEGLAALTARALGEGTGALDGAALTDRFEALGTALETYADWDATVARLTVMPARLTEAFSLFAAVVRAPSFPEKDVERKREERRAELEQRLAEPRGLADQRFTGFLYDASSRYARLAGGTLATLPSLDAGAVRRFHAEHYAPGRTTLIVVGDITPEQARRLADAEFSSWTGRGRVATDVTTRVARVGRRTVIVAKNEAPQSELRVGHVGVPRAHADHLDLVVMNGILGGLFNSRLNLNLREKNAFTYGASSGFDWRRGAGPFVVSTAVKREVTERAVEEILKELDAMRAAEPTPSEVALATDYLAGVFPIRYETTDAVAGALAGWITFGLPEDWFTTYRDRVRAVTPERVHRAARDHLDPARLLVLAVGDAATVRTPLERLGVGETQVVPPQHDPTVKDDEG